MAQKKLNNKLENKTVTERKFAKKPDWLKVKLPIGKEYVNVREIVSKHKLLNNLVFTLEMENEIMSAILDDEKEPNDAAMEWLKANPGALDGWLAGVTTFSGDDGMAAVKSALGM